MTLPPWITNLPTWLKIVGVVVIVLGLLAFGIGAGRASGERDEPSREPPQASLGSFVPAGAVPAARISMTPLPNRSCSRTVRSDGKTQFAGTGCRLTVVPPSGPLPQPQQLHLSRTAGLGEMLMKQEIRGQTPSPRPSPTGIPSDIRVPVAGSSPVEVEFDCQSFPCTLVVER